MYCSVWYQIKVSTELVHQGHMEAGKFHLGTTKIFLRTSTQRTLDAAREAHVRMACIAPTSTLIALVFSVALANHFEVYEYIYSCGGMV